MRHVTWLALSLTALWLFTSNCGTIASGKVRDIQVEVGTQTGLTEYLFDKLGPGETKETVQLVIKNTGDFELEVANIYFEEGSNEDYSIDWKGIHTPASFAGGPVLLAADDPNDVITFVVVYRPEPGVINTDAATLIIENNADKYENLDARIAITFGVKNVGATVCVNIDAPGASSCMDNPLIKYRCVTGCSTTDVYIGNDGTEALTVDQINFSKPTSEFTIVNPPNLPANIPTKGNLNYNPVFLQVRYCPGDDNYEDTNVLQIYSSDFSLVGGVKEISISVEQSPALLDFTTDSPFGYFDFSDGPGTTHKISIYNMDSSECDHLCPDKGQCCGCPIKIGRVVVDNKDVSKSSGWGENDAVKWFGVVAKDPETGAALTLPRAVQGGDGIEFEVVYQKPAGHAEDRNGELCVEYEAPKVGPQTFCVSMLAVSQCELSLAPLTQQLHFNSASPADIKAKAAVVVNSGSAPCSLTHVKVTDKWDGVSEDFSLADTITGGTLVPAFGLFPIWVEYSPHSTDPSGFLKIEYEPTEPDLPLIEESVTLSGSKEQDCAVPVADPGEAADYVGAIAGQPLFLNGCGSSGGDAACGGAPVFESGYLWFLLDKPETSTTSLNQQGSCSTTFNPDLPGNYEIGLVVFDGSNFYQSELETVVISVQDAAE
jgi:hypothetical protein